MLAPGNENGNAKSAHQTLHFAWGMNWAIRQGDWKLIGQYVRKKKTYNTSLHNLAEKQPEVMNHAKAKPELVKRLRALHDQWAQDVKP